MMRKYPSCPKCDEWELWMQGFGDRTYIRCYLCGWQSPAITLPLSVDALDKAIAETVAAARAEQAASTTD